MKKATDVLKNIDTAKASVEFLPTGFKKLDEFLDGGFMRKELVVIGGHTGIGKSYVAGQIFYNIAIQGFKSAYCSLEISNEMVVSRLVGALANIKPTRIYAGKLFPDEIDRKSQGRAKVIAHDEFMDFCDDLYKLEELKNAIKEGGFEFVVIDFIQNVILSGDEYARLSQVALELQGLAKEANCCVLVLSQLSNRVAKDGSKVVEYKGSGSIATVCDLGFFIERSEEMMGKNEVRLNLKKNRRGISGIAFNLEFAHPGGWLSEL